MTGTLVRLAKIMSRRRKHHVRRKTCAILNEDIR